MERLTGWAAFEVVGRHKDLGIYDRPDENGVRPFRSRPLFPGALPRPDRSRAMHVELQRKDGQRLEVEAVITPLGLGGERCSVEVQRVLARMGDGSPMPSQGGTDPVTQLPDADHFLETMMQGFERARRQGTTLAALFVNIDHLSGMVDRLGREGADEIVRRIAGILRASLRQTDVITRLTGDNFGILLEGTGRGDARHVGGRIRQTIERFAFARPGGTAEIRVTVSIGVACYPADGETPAELTRRAEEALSEAHRLGRNRVWCYVRRPRVSLETPVYFEGPNAQRLGDSRDLSNSGVFIETSDPLPLGMRLGLKFRLPGSSNSVHVVGRIARQVTPDKDTLGETAGIAVEFERFEGDARAEIEAFIHRRVS